eukprot:763182-Hanusia_phi.AAC.1
MSLGLVGRDVEHGLRIAEVCDLDRLPLTHVDGRSLTGTQPGPESILFRVLRLSENRGIISADEHSPTLAQAGPCRGGVPVPLRLPLSLFAAIGTGTVPARGITGRWGE